MVAAHAPIDKMNGVIPGEGWTKPLGGAPYQQPPQFVHLDDVLEYIWGKINDPQHGLQIYGLLKAGFPAEAIARTLLFGAFTHGVCTPSVAMMSLKTVVRQIVALGHMLGLKNIKIKNPNKESIKDLATIARAIDERKDGDIENVPTKSDSGVFTGLGM